MLLLSYSISSDALGSPDLLLSYRIVAIPNTHTITIILIITHVSSLKSTLTPNRRYGMKRGPKYIDVVHIIGKGMVKSACR